MKSDLPRQQKKYYIDMNEKDLKIVFFGTPEFAVESLEALIDDGFDVRAVVTMPDKTGGRGHKIIRSAVKLCALRHNIPLLQPEKLSDPSFVGELKAIGADLFIVIAFRMLPRVVWTMPPLGTFNLHGSLLPEYRGAAPINRAVMNGETRTGVTTFMLKHEIDTGDILCQEAIEIGPDENVGSVYERLMHLGARLTVDTVRSIAAGDITPVPQEKLLSGSKPTPAPKIFHDDCRIDWTKSRIAIHNHVRGLSPVPGAWSNLKLSENAETPGTTLKILATSVGIAGPELSPGQLARTADGIFAGAGDGSVQLVTVQPAGKRAMDASAWFCGLHTESDGYFPLLC